MKYPEQEERERRERARNVAAWSNEIGAFCLGASAAVFVLAILGALTHSTTATTSAVLIYVCAFLFYVGAAVPYLGPHIFRR